MAKKIFKGIKQVDSVKFNATEDKSGYLWFVRTAVLADGENADANDVNNDEYDIYFGSKHYGHYQEGELANIRTQIEALNGQIEEILGLLETLTGLAESNKAAHEKNAGDIQSLGETLATYLVKDVDVNDSVLTVADGILSSTIGLAYENNRISLVDKNNEEIAGFDASDFIKDSVLDDVKVETKEDGEKYIIFTWKTEGEDTKTDEIKVSDFAKLYNPGTGLELAADGVTFNVKVAENGNFLTVNDNNELIVDDMTVDKTILKEAITIEGGPLATDSVKNAFEGGIIPAGTDIQAVLKALLCVEIYPVPTKNIPKFTVTITAPTIQAPDGLTNIGTTSKPEYLAEIGQVLSFGTVTATNSSISKTEPKVSGFEHGYSDTIDGEKISSTSITASWSVKQKNKNVYLLTPSATNFIGTLPSEVYDEVSTNCILPAVDLTVADGANTYKVTEDGPAFIGSHNGIASKYIVSNLGGRKEEEKSVAIDAEENVEVDSTNKTGSLTVTGVYPIFTNGVAGSVDSSNKPVGDNLTAPVSGDGTKLKLMKKGSTFVVSFASQGLEPYKLYLPKGWSITQAYYSDPLAGGALQADGLSFFKQNGEATRTIQNVEGVKYNVYEWDGTQGADFVKFTVA